ncbi:MAG: BsuPI-related putative proteinase inhibitor [Chloroherpetonaceae bacterium]|nr:BsuPI-related putative proteinase inhibitor [Chthonomonadaceae bacterium]MDW8207231.1 BsuPI-related putative proteinase inhibitor [Chloroherpetonaceae bacterium]
MFLRIMSAAIVLGILFSLPGCGNGSTTPNVPPTRDAVGRSVPQQRTLEGFQVTVQTDKTTYAPGEPIEIIVSATNTGTQPRTLRYPTDSAYHRWGYIIARDGRIVTYEYWEGHGDFFAQIIGEDTYQPGETRTFRYRFPYRMSSGEEINPPEQLPPGTYQVYARMPETVYVDNFDPIRHTEPTPASQPVTIVVEPAASQN